MKGKIFNTQEVQAIIAGNKTQFMEVIKPQPNEQQKHIHKTTFSQNKEEIGNVFLSNHSFADFISRKVVEERIKCPYQVGQKIFCKESFAEVEVGAGMGYNSGKQALYKAVDDYDVNWKPAQHMKQEHSRLTLQIKEIRVERLADISEEDAVAEGVERGIANGEQCGYKDYFVKNLILADAKDSFKTLWNATHKKSEEKFEASPFVWVVSFEVVKND
jgi:hypothetical protein